MFLFRQIRRAAIRLCCVGIMSVSTTVIHAQERATAVFAGGCFWCVESDFESVTGVIAAVSGFTGGHVENPSYKQVTRGGTGHYEAVEITYDPSQISYAQLLHLFLRSVDPTDAGGQFCDRGESYRTAIFVASDQERRLAQQAITRARRDLGRRIVTPVLDLTTFYMAEDYHQDYYKGRNRVLTRFGVVRQYDAYARYREGCGRDRRVKELWGADAPFVH